MWLTSAVGAVPNAPAPALSISPLPLPAVLHVPEHEFVGVCFRANRDIAPANRRGFREFLAAVSIDFITAICHVTCDS